MIPSALLRRSRLAFVALLLLPPNIAHAQPRPLLETQEQRRTYFRDNEARMAGITVEDAERMVAAMAALQRRDPNAPSTTASNDYRQSLWVGDMAIPAHTHPQTAAYIGRRVHEAFTQWLMRRTPESMRQTIAQPMMRDYATTVRIRTFMWTSLLTMCAMGPLSGATICWGPSGGWQAVATLLAAMIVTTPVITGSVYARINSRERNEALDWHAQQVTHFDSSTGNIAFFIREDPLGIWLNAELQSHGIHAPAETALSNLSPDSQQHLVWRIIHDWLVRNPAPPLPVPRSDAEAIGQSLDALRRVRELRARTGAPPPTAEHADPPTAVRVEVQGSSLAVSYVADVAAGNGLAEEQVAEFRRVGCTIELTAKANDPPEPTDE